MYKLETAIRATLSHYGDIMNKNEVKLLSSGLYKIYWKTGGTSQASVGVMADGGKWLAPTNWVAPTSDPNIWKSIEKVKLIGKD